MAQNDKQTHRDKQSGSRFIFGFHVTYRVVKTFLLVVFFSLVGLGFLGAGIGLGYFASLVSTTDVPTKAKLEKQINDISLISQINYAGGESIGTIQSDLIRTKVNSKDISPYVKKALIATEDQYFEQHNGVVPKAVLRALVSEATGLGSSGGSTLTQQLVKQQVLTSETTFKRKANEIVLALRVEKYFTKDEILTAYLNVSPFGRNNKGQNIAGVEEAAKGIFGVSASKLSLAQAAFIAGLPQSPITYSPFNSDGSLKSKANLKYGLERKNDVLFNMYREHKISKKEYTAAKAVDLTQQFKGKESVSTANNDYLYYYAQKEAIKALMPIYYEADKRTKADIEASDELYNRYYKIASRELRRNGYTVHTTIKKNVYDAMQQSVANNGYLLDEGNGKLVQTGMVLMNNQTGEIYGFVGGRDFQTSQSNHAFDTKRSPGSTMKPILAYAPAIDQGIIGSESMLSNFPTKYKSSNESLTNYGGTSGNSFVSVRSALRQSLNIPVYHLYQELLQKTDPTTYFKKMNISADPDELKVESAPLGTADMSVYEETNAFATLANQGTYEQGYIISSITDANGKTIYQHKAAGTQVYAKATASIMNNLMRDVIHTSGGTGTTALSSLQALGSNLANADWVGKTGTANTDNDFWFTASTPSVTLGSWIGYDDNSTMNSSWGHQNMKLWANVANSVYAVEPDIFGVSQKFTLDSSVAKAQVSSFTGTKFGSFSYNNRTVTVPGTKVTSYFVNSDAVPAASYQFGVGGTDANYSTVWNKYGLRSSSKTTTSSSSKADD